MSRNLRFDPFLVQHGAKYLATGPKMQFPNIHPINIYAKFEVNWTKTFWDNAWKQLFRQTDGPTDGQMLTITMFPYQTSSARINMLMTFIWYICMQHFVIFLSSNSFSFILWDNYIFLHCPTLNKFFTQGPGSFQSNTSFTPSAQSTGTWRWWDQWISNWFISCVYQ